MLSKILIGLGLRKIIKSDTKNIGNLISVYRTVLSKKEHELTIDICRLSMTKIIHLKVGETVVSITPDGIFVKAKNFEIIP